MAIMNSMIGEREELRRRMDCARSRDEYEYYRDRMYELERRETMRYRDMNFLQDVPRYPPQTPKLMMDPAAPATPDPLSFMRNANNNLLLIGATT